MLRIIGFIALAVCSGAFTDAQQAVSASGGKDNGPAGNVSYTAEKTNKASLINNSGKEIQGVMPPFEIQTVTKLDPAPEITLECEAFPNPATDFLILKINRDPIENLKYQLFDLNGKVLEEAFIGDKETAISLKHYKPDNYILNVLDHSEEVMTFKITKKDRK